jgi:hypothetical protein
MDLAAEKVDDSHILEFARQYGTLLLCEHFVPIGRHHPEPLSRLFRPAALAQNAELFETVLRQAGEDGRDQQCRLSHMEPLSEWRYWARRAAAMATIIAHVRQGQPGRTGDWSTFFERWEDTPPYAMYADKPVSREERIRKAAECTAKEQLYNIALEVRNMIAETGLRPYLEVDLDGGTRFVLEGYGVLGSVARELAFRLSGDVGLTVCHNCGQPFMPGPGPGGRIRRRPAGKRDHYCDEPDCKKAARKNAQTRYRAKKAPEA